MDMDASHPAELITLSPYFLDRGFAAPAALTVVLAFAFAGTRFYPTATRGAYDGTHPCAR